MKCLHTQKSRTFKWRNVYTEISSKWKVILDITSFVCCYKVKECKCDMLYYYKGLLDLGAMCAAALIKVCNKSIKYAIKVKVLTMHHIVCIVCNIHFVFIGFHK